MYRIFLVLLLCIFFVGCSDARNASQIDNIDLEEARKENEPILSLNEEKLYTFQDPIYNFSVVFPERFSFFLYGYDRSFDSDYESPDRTIYIFLDVNHIFDFVNYIDVTGQLGSAKHLPSSGEKRIDFINDAGQEATMYYYLKDDEIIFEYTIKNGNQFVRGCFESDFYEKNKETIFDICKSVQDSP